MQSADVGASRGAHSDVEGVVSVAAAVESDLARFPADVQQSTLAATARALASRMDDPEAPAYAVAAASKEMREVFAAMRQQAPVKAPSDSVDDIAAARAKRLGNANA